MAGQLDTDHPLAPPDSSIGGARVVSADNFRAVLVAWIIACHALLGYTAIGGWPYSEVTEAIVSPGVELALSVVVGPTGLFVIGTFFFVAGMFAPHQMARMGPARFVRGRAVRLGVPWLFYTLLVWPLFMWLAYRSAGHPLSYWQVFLGRQPFLDSGPLWFAQVLLDVSIGYALWTWVRRGRRFETKPLKGRHLVMVAATIALVSFVVRLAYPARSEQIFDLHLWQWPQCVGMFCLGAIVSGQGWIRQVPADIARRCGITLAATFAALPLIAASTGVTNVPRDGAPFLGGWRWQAPILDVVEAILVVAGSIWLLAMAQRRLTSQAVVWDHSARAAYAAFMLQVPVLIGLEIAARPLPLPAAAKMVPVAALAVAASFGLGWLIIRGTRLRRML